MIGYKKGFRDPLNYFCILQTPLYNKMAFSRHTLYNKIYLRDPSVKNVDAHTKWANFQLHIYKTEFYHPIQQTNIFVNPLYKRWHLYTTYYWHFQESPIQKYGNLHPIQKNDIHPPLHNFEYNSCKIILKCNSYKIVLKSVLLTTPCSHSRFLFLY